MYEVPVSDVGEKFSLDNILKVLMSKHNGRRDSRQESEAPPRHVDLESAVEPLPVVEPEPMLNGQQTLVSEMVETTAAPNTRHCKRDTTFSLLLQDPEERQKRLDGWI
jgi:hypothetical protein